MDLNHCQVIVCRGPDGDAYRPVTHPDRDTALTPPATVDSAAGLDRWSGADSLEIEDVPDRGDHPNRNLALSAAR